MAFGLIRVRNLSAGDIDSTDKHNARRYEKKEQYPENVPFEKREDSFIRVQYLEGNESEFLSKEESNQKTNQLLLHNHLHSHRCWLPSNHRFFISYSKTREKRTRGSEST